MSCIKHLLYVFIQLIYYICIHVFKYIFCNISQTYLSIYEIFNMILIIIFSFPFNFNIFNVFEDILQNNRFNKICSCICVYIYIYIYTYIYNYIFI